MLLILKYSFILITTLFVISCGSNPHKDIVINDHLGTNAQEFNDILDNTINNTSIASMNAVRAFKYHPKTLNNCITDNADYYYKSKQKLKNISIKDCLFASRIENIASFSILNTDYAKDKLSTTVLKKDKYNNVDLLNVSTNFFIDKKSTFVNIVRLVASRIDYKFNLVNPAMEVNAYNISHYKTRAYETPMGFLSRIENNHNSLVSIKIKNKSIYLSFLNSHLSKPNKEKN